RAAAALPRAGRAHEPGGAAAALPRGSRALRALDAPPPLRHAGPDLPLADPRAQRSRLRGVDAPGSRVRGPSVLPARSEDPGPHAARGALGAGGVLSLFRRTGIVVPVRA